MAKISFKKASNGLNTFHIGGSMIATTDFGQPQVSFFAPVVPSDKLHVRFDVEARFAPMVVPTFMNVNLYTRAFFVPMSAIWKPFEYYYTDAQDQTAFKQLPTFTNEEMVEFFRNTSNGLADDTTSYRQNGDVDDFVIKDGSLINTYRFTEKGRLFKKLLDSLGYSINFALEDTTSFSALPLLAYLRIFYDYIYPSQYVQGLSLSRYFNITSSADFTASWVNGMMSFFLTIADSLVVPFRQDYFTAAWKSLNAPGTAQQSLSLVAPDNSIVENSNMKQTALNTNYGAVSQIGLNLLSRLYDFVTRNNLVGTRYADQLFARFGIGSRKSDKDMSLDLGRNMTPLHVADVTQMAQTEEGNLGELGGKMFVTPNGKGVNLCNYDAEEFGFIICISQIMPEIGYYQGRKLWTIARSRLDGFYYPEFDMQMRAIRNDELFADYSNSQHYVAGQSYGGNPSNVFGFAPNYSEYKKKHDYLIGDFRVPSLATNMKPYYLFRDLDAPSPNTPLSLSAPFLFCPQHKFDKIFAQPYVQRYPLGLLVRQIEMPDSFTSDNTTFHMETANVIALGTKPIIAELEGVHYWLWVQDNNTIRLLTMTANVYASIEEKYEVSMYQHIQGYYQGTILGQTFTVRNFISCGTLVGTDMKIANLFPNVSSTSGVNALTFSEFLVYFSDYVDHCYIHYEWDVQAQRPMATISEEFMIQDGGNTISADLLGNRE